MLSTSAGAHAGPELQLCRQTHAALRQEIQVFWRYTGSGELTARRSPRGWVTFNIVDAV
jgi:hypothetical protein